MTTLLLILAFLAGLLVAGLAFSAATSGERNGDERGPYARLVKRALARLAAGDDRGAVALLRQATSMQARDDAVYLLLAEELRRTGDRSRAARAAEVLLAGRTLEPEIACGAWMLKGRLAEERGELEAALEAYRRAAEAAPEASGPAVAEGRLLTRLRRWEEAIEAAHRLARLEPERGRLVAARRRVLHARELLAEGRATEARVQAEAALEEAPTLTAARFVLGDALFQLGRRKEAIERWIEAAREAPARCGLALERIEQVASDGEARTRARDLAAEVAAAGSDWRAAAWLVHRALQDRRPDEAERWLEKVERAAPASASAARLRVRLAATRSPVEPAGALGELLARWSGERAWTDPWRCARCGFESTSFEWRCSECHAWDAWR